MSKVRALSLLVASCLMLAGLGLPASAQEPSASDPSTKTPSAPSASPTPEPSPAPDPPAASPSAAPVSPTPEPTPSSDPSTTPPSAAPVSPTPEPTPSADAADARGQSDAASGRSDDVDDERELRTRNSRTFQRADGTYETEFYPAAIHFRDGRGWKAIDNTLVPSSVPGFALQNAANDHDVLLPEDLASGAVKIAFDDEWVTFSLRDVKASASARGPSASYVGAAPGMDVVYTADGDGVKEEIFLRDADASRPLTFDFKFSSGVTPEQVDGGLRLVTRSGRDLFLPAPFMYDAQGAYSDAIDVDFESDRSSGTLTYEADSGWVQDASRAFPIVIDPVVRFYGPYDDCYLNSGSPSSSFCSSTTNRIGFDGTNRYRALLKFPNLNSVIRHDALLSAASIEANVSTSTSGGLPVSVHRASKDWTTAANWNTYNGSTAWGTPGGDFGSPYDERTIGSSTGITELFPGTLVQGWLDGSIPNQGLLIKSANETTAKTVSLTSWNSSTSANWALLRVDWKNRLGVTDFYTYESRQISDRMSYRVNVANGNGIIETTDLKIGGTGLDLDVTRYYNNRYNSTTLVGDSWNLGVGGYVEIDSSGQPDAEVKLPSNHRLFFFHKPDGTFQAPPGANADLTEHTDGTFTLKFHSSDEKWVFAGPSDALTQRIDRNGNTITYAYDSSNRLSTITDTRGRAVTFTYTSGLLTKVTDSSGRFVTYGYNSSDEMTSSTDAEGKITLYEYDVNDDLSKITTPEGRVTKIETLDDSVTKITQVTDPVSGTGPSTTFSYSAPSLPLSESSRGTTTLTDARGNVTTYTWDTHDRVRKVVDARLNEQATSYNSNNNVSTYTDGELGQTLFDYVPGTGDVNKVTLPTGAVSSFTYDPGKHRPKDHTDVRGNVYDFGYDTNGNLTSVTNDLPSENRFEYTYNPNGTLATVKDARLKTTVYSYFTNGELQTIDYPGPLGNTAFTYDTLSRVKTVTDGKGQTTTYTYDKIDRVKTITYHDGTVITYTYDFDGNLLSRAVGTNTTSYEYDDMSRLEKKTFPGGTFSTYTYDPASNLKTMTDAGGTTVYDYDVVNNLEKLTEPDGQFTTFTSDKANRRKTTTYPNGVILTTNRTAGLVDSVVAKKGTTTLTSFAYDYILDANSKRTPLRRTVTDKNGMVTTYSYDVLNRLKTANRSNTAALDFEYFYDGNGNRTKQIVNASTTTNYVYNDANQLDCSYTGTTVATCALAPLSKVTYTYDLNGNQTGDSAGQVLSYNAKDQATSAKKAGGIAQTQAYAGATQVERTQRGSTTFVNDLLGVSSETTSSATTRFIRDDQGGLVGMKTASGAKYYYTFDALGSVAALTDSSGLVATSYSYTPYGETTKTGTVANPFQFAGGYNDEVTGLYKFGQRYYQPDISRWTQRDPQAGQLTEPMTLNPYQYSGLDPVNHKDLTGRSHFDTDCSDVPPQARPFCAEDYFEAFLISAEFALGCAAFVAALTPLYPFLTPLGAGLVAATGCLVGGVAAVAGAFF